MRAIAAGMPLLASYPDPEYRQLRSALGARHGLDPDWILPGNGAAELLTWAARDLAQYDRTHVFVPGFRDYGRALRAFDARICPHPLAEFGGSDRVLSLAQVGAIAFDRAGLLLNDPHNPTGKRCPRSLVRSCLEQSALAVVDEAFIDFLPPDEQQSWVDEIADWDNLVVLRSLTKFYSLPGLRLGYAVGHPNRLRRWQQWRDPWSVNVLADVAARAAIADEEFARKTWEWLVPAREELQRGLSALPGLHPGASVANFLLVQSDRSASELQEHLLREYRLLIRDCLSFPELGDRYFRIAVRTPDENRRLVSAIAAIWHDESCS